jgi:hypothetical protein
MKCALPQAAVAHKADNTSTDSRSSRRLAFIFSAEREVLIV